MVFLEEGFVIGDILVSEGCGWRFAGPNACGVWFTRPVCGGFIYILGNDAWFATSGCIL